ncbi:MAG TPA: hydroxymethylpyrimidine/phosphomethylpyrimidine kinase [Usitatibacteraceae bacterium]|nr:hydroxymethylpyrimidine/phosphomethylpyrimidine kinase [Usitatibacteraceae bacterium]
MPASLPPPPAVLAFAASDPSCGAGLAADILSLASMGCHPLLVLTAITVQDTSGVEGMLAMDSDWVADQARAILEDVPVSAFKIGVMGSVENIAAIAEIVSDYPEIPLVLDPVFVSGRGDELAGDDCVEAIKELLVPQATVLTPNTPELRRLALADDESDPGIEVLARRLLSMGAEHVLVTGTHESTADVTNILFGDQGILRTDTWRRLPGSYHGSGCTLAAAIAAILARGVDLPDAVREAQEYTWQTLANGYRPGMGQFIPDRMFWARDEEDTEAAATSVSPASLARN